MGRRHSRQQHATVGAVLRALRERKGLTQAEVARRLGTRQTYVSRYEAGEQRLDPLDLLDVCRAIGVSPRTVVERLDRELPPRK